MLPQASSRYLGSRVLVAVVSLAYMLNTAEQDSIEWILLKKIFLQLDYADAHKLGS